MLRRRHVSPRRLLVLLAALSAVALAVMLVPLPHRQAAQSDDAPASPLVSTSSRMPQTGNLPVTYPDFSYGLATQSPTKDKPQSKLWYQAGSWWALMVNPNTSDVRIFELLANHAWRDTGTEVDERLDSTADALWDGQRLHVVTRTGTGEIRYLSLVFVPDRRSYRAEQATPVVLATGGAKSVAVALDSRQRPWATFMQRGAALVTRATDADATIWSVPAAPAGTEALATADDISSIDTMPGAIVVMWSNQRTGAFYLAEHRDGDAEGSWRPVETPLSGSHMADGHLSLVVRPDGVVYAAVKTSLDDVPGGPGASPLLYVLERAPSGAWTSHVAATVADGVTRAELTLSLPQRRLYLSFAAPSGGGELYYKVASLDDVRFVPGRGTSLTNVPGAQINNVTSTKQSVDAGTGLVLLASDDSSRRYYHVELAVSPQSRGG